MTWVGSNRQKFTPAQNLIYTRRRAELAAR
ncbi:MAG TPA: hypothetical protein K8V00_06340 [Ligilactobacillus acidipiscis]|uniref:Uncharacterized protein n=1 Tax=Ligilactobacillus acidipiscis TaxID=89059 RepID=A0A921K0Q9_9LACO|nr:hypothetical protein [Ligilactobacillus acidipiscis]